MSSQNRQSISKTTALSIAAFMILIMVLYLGRLFSLQIIDNYVYSTQADNVSRRSQIIPTRRGEIFDRNFDQPLVTNIDSFTLLLDLSQVPADGLQNLVSRLAEELGTDEQYIWSKIPLRRTQSFANYEILSGITFSQITRLAERIEDFPGISWISRPNRYYPFGDLLSHVLGYTGAITAEELQILYNQGYAGARDIGKAGIEKQYDNILRGADGLRYDRVDARGRQVQDLEDIPPELGNSVVLTIDRHIQELSERALGRRTGGVIVLDPGNGEILAMASYPDYDPNIFYTAGSDEVITRLHNDPRSPLLNRTIQAAGSPASTFKTLMSIAMLQEQAFDPLEEIYCPGYVIVGDRVFRCHKLEGHGSLNMYEALAESCNVYYYTIGKDYLDVDGILDYSLRLGLGEASGIDLPGEIPGLLPTPEWKERTYNTPWVGGDTVNLSIGQGFLTTTPLQLANITAAIYNNGRVYQPHLLKEIRDQETLQLLDRFEPRLLRETGIDPAVYEEVRRAMRLVITDGTAQVVITSDASEIAGKTGTAQTGDVEQKHSWFIAYTPAEPDETKNAYVVVVWVDATNPWEWWAPKAANIILHGITRNLSFEDAIRDLQPLWYFPLNMLNSITE